jgi:hypothetical protein
VARLLECKEADTISALENRWLLNHIEACELCAELALCADPLFLLTPLSAARDPRAEAYADGAEDTDLAFLKASVGSAVKIESFRRKLARPTTHAWLKIAASVTFAACVGLWYFSAARQDAEVKTSDSTLSSPESPSRLATVAGAEIPWVEEVANPGAKVYQFSPSAPGEPMVVFVVNRNADL